MKKKILIALLSITLIGLIIGTMYIIDRKRTRYTNPSENDQKIDNIVLNDDYIMQLISYDIEGREISEDLKELQELKYPSAIKLSRALALYVKSDIEQNSYDKLHDINLFFEGEEKNFSITMSMLGEPLTDYKDFNNKNNYKQSLINGNEVVILHNDNKDSVNQKQYYVCIFKYNDVYFVIETTNLSQEEVITLVKSIFNCDMKSMINKQSNNNYSFYATVIETNKKNIIVKPLEGSKELRSSDKFSIRLCENNDVNYPSGTTIKITYDGIIMETYPAKINASKIEICSNKNIK